MLYLFKETYGDALQVFQIVLESVIQRFGRVLQKYHFVDYFTLKVTNEKGGAVGEVLTIIC